MARRVALCWKCDIGPRPGARGRAALTPVRIPYGPSSASSCTSRKLPLRRDFPLWERVCSLSTLVLMRVTWTRSSASRGTTGGTTESGRAGGRSRPARRLPSCRWRPSSRRRSGDVLRLPDARVHGRRATPRRPLQLLREARRRPSLGRGREGVALLPRQRSKRPVRAQGTRTPGPDPARQARRSRTDDALRARASRASALPACKAARAKQRVTTPDDEGRRIRHEQRACEA